MKRVRVSQRQLEDTFRVFRECGGGKRECQVLWLSPWADPDSITEVVHSRHSAHVAAFRVEDAYIHKLWLELARSNQGVRAQVHTHPGHAFHSAIDDQWPMIHVPGFLSIVVPVFAMGPVGFSDTYVGQITVDGAWRECDPLSVFEVV